MSTAIGARRNHGDINERVTCFAIVISPPWGATIVRGTPKRAHSKGRPAMLPSCDIVKETSQLTC